MVIMKLTKIKKIMIGHIHTLQKKPKQVSKNKPPVLLLHGAWHGAWCWEGNYLDYFADAGHETWAMDLSGHGESGKKKPLRFTTCLLYTSPSPRDATLSRMPSSA